jgi:hypothetical protein
MKAAPAPPLLLIESISGRLRDGLLRLDANGQVRSANSAARPWLRDCIYQAATFAGLIAAVKRGRLVLPRRLSVLDDCQHCADSPQEVWLDHEGKHNYVLLILPRPAAATVASKQGPAYPENFVNLIGADLRAQVEQVCEQLDAVGEPGFSPEELQRLAPGISAGLRELNGLAELYQHEQPFTDERFGLAPLLAEILPGLPRQSGPFAIRYSYLEGPGIGQIYGHRVWLRRALNSLLGRLGEGCPPGHQINTSLRQFGDFVIVAGAVAVDRSRPALVHGQVAQTGRGYGLGLPACQRIFELHGGALKIEYSPRNDESSNTTARIESFVLTLPTGLPAQGRASASCGDCRISRQAQETLRDLVQLMDELARTKDAETTAAKESHEHDPDRR